MIDRRVTDRRTALTALGLGMGLGIGLGLAGCSGGGDAGSPTEPPPQSPSVTPGAYMPDDGLIVVEFESTNATGAWSEETALAGFTGSSYLRWSGANEYSTPGVDTFAVDFWIEDAGRYHFRLHNRHEDPDPTLANDVWTRVDGGDWVKTFSWQRGQWTWVTQHEFSHNNKPPAEYTLARGNHTIEFSGRSFDFMIDRFHFYDDGVVNPEDTGHPESSRAGGPPGATAGSPSAGGGRQLTVSPFHLGALSASGGLGFGPAEDELERLDAALDRSRAARSIDRPIDVVLFDARSIAFGGVDLTAPSPARSSLIARATSSLTEPELRWVIDARGCASLPPIGALVADLRAADPLVRPVLLRVAADVAAQSILEIRAAGFDAVEHAGTCP